MLSQNTPLTIPPLSGFPTLQGVTLNILFGTFRAVLGLRNVGLEPSDANNEFRQQGSANGGFQTVV